MSIFLWSQSLYGTGIAKVDEQHRDIFALANGFYTACTELRGQRELGVLFNSLIEHALAHFAMEEDLMSEHAYPEQAHHEEIHRQMLQTLTEKHERFLAGEISMAGEMLEFLGHWLEDHVTSEDRKLVNYIKQQQRDS